MLFAYEKMSRVGTFILSHTLDWSFFCSYCRTGFERLEGQNKTDFNQRVLRCAGAY
jgi:hypothetical protein